MRNHTLNGACFQIGTLRRAATAAAMLAILLCSQSLFAQNPNPDEGRLKSALLSATVRAIGFEIQMYEIRLNAAKNGPGDPANIPVFETKIAELKDELARTAQTAPSDFVLPPRKTVQVTVTQPYTYGAILEVDNMTRSGPFYHVTGITDDDFSLLQPGKTYALTLYLVRTRDYVLPSAENAYVYVQIGDQPAGYPEGTTGQQSTPDTEGQVPVPPPDVQTTPSFGILSLSPRQTGREILFALSLGTDSFTIRTSSNGCTFKSSFRVEIYRVEGVSSELPHYEFTIYRVQPDDCKMIVHDGVEITFDLVKDLEITGPCTYSVTNWVYRSAGQIR
mgnify:CR=1 FL=1|jgi:hypothetical protein